MGYSHPGRPGRNVTDDGAELSRRRAACPLSRHPRSSRGTRARTAPERRRDACAPPRRASTPVPGIARARRGLEDLLRRAARLRRPARPARRGRPGRRRALRLAGVRPPPRPSPGRRLGPCPTRPIADLHRRALDAYAGPRAARRGRRGRVDLRHRPRRPPGASACEAVAGARGDEPRPPAVEPRSTGRSTRSGGSSDPHRAIDWLSTFPQVVLVALGERP